MRVVQGGDIVNGDGSGGESIYGEPFEDESHELTFQRPGMLAMAGSMCAAPPPPPRRRCRRAAAPHATSTSPLVCPLLASPYDDVASDDDAYACASRVAVGRRCRPMRDKASEEMMHVPHRNTSQFFITTAPCDARSAHGPNGVHKLHGAIVTAVLGLLASHRQHSRNGAFVG